MNKKIISQRLSKALADSGLSQNELAAKAKLTESSISHYLHARHVPSIKSAEAISKVLNVDPSWLLGFDVPKDDKFQKSVQFSHQTDAVQALFASAGWDCQEVFENDELVDYAPTGEPIYQPALIGYKLSSENSSFTISTKDYDEIKNEITSVFSKKFLEIVTKNLSSFMESK